MQKTRQIIDDNNLMSTSMSDKDRLIKLQIYLNNTINSNVNDTVYEGYISRVLIDGDSVCDGYATTFCFLCECIDIPCYWVGGSADNGDGTGFGGHAWNKVKVDGKWYYIDAYWDVCLNDFEYFLTETLWSIIVLKNKVLLKT